MVEVGGQRLQRATNQLIPGDVQLLQLGEELQKGPYKATRGNRMLRLAYEMPVQMSGCFRGPTEVQISCILHKLPNLLFNRQKP